jgi:hypothetical protein
MYKNLVSSLSFFLLRIKSSTYTPLVCQLHIQELRGPTPLNYQFLFDTASTALMASSAYHLDLVAGVDTCIPEAENSRKALS